MTYKGHIEKGMVVLDEPVELPEGAEVRIDVISGPALTEGVPRRSLYDELKRFAGKGQDMPEDLALNHDHYLHGMPKK